MTEEEQIEYVQENYRNMRDIKNPSEKIQLAAVKQNKFAIFYIKNPFEKVIRNVLKNDMRILSYTTIKNNKKILLLQENITNGNNLSSILFMSKYLNL